MEFLVGGSVVASVRADLFRPDLLAAGVGDGRHGFSCELPLAAQVFEAKAAEGRKVVARVVGARKALPGSPRPLRPARGLFDGRLLSGITQVSHGKVSGHAVDLDNPSRALTLDVYLDDRLVGTVTADTAFAVDAAAVQAGHGFVADLSAHLTGGHQLLTICVGGTDTLVEGSPQVIGGAKAFLGHLDTIDDDHARGWAWLPQHGEGLPVEVLVDGRLHQTVRATRFRKDLKTAGIGDGHHAFSVELPAFVFDGRPHEIAARVAGSGRDLTGSPFVHCSFYEGFLDGLRDGNVHGWVVDVARPFHRVSVDVTVASNRTTTVVADRERGDLRERGYPDTRHGFLARVVTAPEPHAPLVIQARVHNTQAHLTGSPSVLITQARALTLARKALHLAAAAASEGPEREAALAAVEALTPPERLYYKKYLLPRLQAAIVGEPMQPFVVPAAALDQASGSGPASETLVDVVIPVYRGLAETIECIESVMRAGNRHGSEVVVYLDNPDDREMRAALRRLAQQHRLTLIENRHNLGFVQTVNLGMRRAPERDVILLNADTVVHGDWLDRLRRAAYSATDVGTVTALSNNATICSYPRFCDDNRLPSDVTAPELDALCREENAGQTVAIPTAVGYCMYIRRDCLEETGLFDEETWGKGYAEENDFCLRAASLGWRHLLAADVFVRHHGSLSFGPDSAAACARNLGTLQQRYPYYDEMIREFVARDPARPLRRRLDMARLARRGGERFCMVTHTLGGGTERHVQDLVRQLRQQGTECLVLRSADGRFVEVDAPELEGITNLVYDLPDERGELVNDLRRLNVRHMHLHQIINVPPSLLTLAGSLGVAYDCTVHDYSWICPRVNLIDESGVYCGEPAVESCERCLTVNGAHPAWMRFHRSQDTVADLRARSGDCLSGARIVFCPSADVAERIRRYAPESAVRVRPHQELLMPLALPAASSTPARGARLRVGVIGAIGLNKGFEVLAACATHATKHDLPLEFVVVGYSCDDELLLKTGRVAVLGEYAEGSAHRLLAEERLRVALFPNVWPETFSYALSLALQAGIWPVAFDLGAIAERIRSTGFGTVIPLTTDPAAVNAALLAAGERGGPAAPPFQAATYPDVLRDYYEMSIDADAAHS